MTEKNRGTHRYEERYSNGAARACEPAAPPNCVNPPFAGSRSSSAVVLLLQFSSISNLKAFSRIFVLSDVPHRAAPRFPAPFALCAAVCAFRGWGGVCTRQSPLKRALRRLWAMCEKSVWILLRRWRKEPFGVRFFLLTMPCFGGFRPLFTRSIKAQDKRPQSQAPAARPQSPAVRGFSEKRQPPSVWRFYRTIAVGHSAKSRVCRALRRF